MEPEVIDLNRAVIGLGVIAAIPIVIYALWAEYFGQHLHQLHIKNPKFDREAELEKVKIASIFVLLFQFTLFLGSSELRKDSPFLTQLIFLITIVVQIYLQRSLEKQVSPSDSRTGEVFRLLIKAGISWAIGVGIYGASLFLIVGSALFLGHHFHLSSLTNTLLFIGAGGLGIFTGLCINFALAPAHLRRILPLTPLANTPWEPIFKQCFEKANKPLPEVWIIELKALRFNAPFAVGLRAGKGICRPGIFVSRYLLESLSQSELEAVIFNQLSHTVLNHSRARFFLSCSLIGGTTLLAILCILLFQNPMTPRAIIELVGPAIAVCSFLVSFKLLAYQSRKQELTTNIFTIENFEVPLPHLVSALRKLDLPMDPSTPQLSLGQPATERRIHLLEQYFKIDPQTHSQTSKENQNPRKAA